MSDDNLYGAFAASLAPLYLGSKLSKPTGETRSKGGMITCTMVLTNIGLGSFLNMHFTPIFFVCAFCVFN